MDTHKHEQSSQQHAPVTNDDSLRIVLSRANDPQICTFWVGLYKNNGTGSTKEFLQIERLDEAFRYLIEVGLTEHEPLMLSDNTGAVHRQFFLLPQKAFAADPVAGKLLISKTLSDLVQKKAGIHLASSIAGAADRQEILTDLVVGLARHKMEEIHLLTADIGVNQLLNVSLTAKESLKAVRDVWIFH